MIDFLLGVPGALKTLTDRLTATWSAKLDTLHDTRLTSTRAGYLDKLNVGGNLLTDTTLTSARAAKLDAVAQESSPLIASPIATGFTSGAVAHNNITSSNDIAGAIGGTAATSTPGTSYVDAINITGAGVLNALFAFGASGSPGLKLTIDGVAVSEVAAGSANQWQVHAGGLHLNDSTSNLNAIALDQIPFKASLRVQIKSTAGASMTVVFKYRRTA